MWQGRFRELFVGGQWVAPGSSDQIAVVEVNGSAIGLCAPQGGFKQSGIGRELGVEGFDAFVELKSLGLPPDLAS